MNDYSKYIKSKHIKTYSSSLQEREQNEVSELKNKIDSLQKEVVRLKELLASQDSMINELHEQLEVSRKSPGRKSRFDENTKLEIRALRKNGMSINRIAARYNCSTSVIGRITKDIKLDLRTKTRN